MFPKLANLISFSLCFSFCFPVLLTIHFTAEANERISSFNMSGNRYGRGGNYAPRLDLEGQTKTLFVKNLPYSIDEEELKSAFAGAVAARLPLRDDGRIKGFGYVEFGNVDEAVDAFASMNGAAIGGREVFLDYSEERSGGGGGRGWGVLPIFLL